MTLTERYYALNDLVQEVKRESFHEPNNVSDADAFGLLISQYFDAHPTPILKAAASALEDANAHGVAAYLRRYAA